MQDKQIVQLPGKLVTDTSYNNQPDGSHSFALNVVPESDTGDIGFLSNELGTSNCVNLGTYKLIGNITLTNNEHVLFLAKEDGSNSKIALLKNCNLTTIVEDSCLNFQIEYPVTGIFKIKNGCRRIIYFRDSFNSDRVIDIDEILINPDNNIYYDGSWKCKLFKINLDFQYPCLSYSRTNNSGGSLKLGTYQFAVALGDKNLNFTNPLSITQPIPIINGQLNGSNNKLQGGTVNTLNNTTKSIDLQISNLDLDYSYIKIYVIENISSVITSYEVDTLSISNSSILYTYRGLDYSVSTVVPLSKINVPNIVYDKSKTLEQHDQRLIRANLKERKISNNIWQKAANLIKTRYVTKPILYNSNIDVFSGNYYTDYRSYMRDEVYALSISGVFSDGTSTSEIHIPGRLKNLDWNGGSLPQNNDPFGQSGLKQHNRKDPINGWDSTQYIVTNTLTYPTVTGNVQNWNNITLSSNQVSSEDCKAINKNPNDTVERWELYNTAYIEEINTLSDSFYTKGQMSYWESTFDYPDVTDCNNERIFPTGKIRHHKMPDSMLEPHHINDGSNDYILSLGLEFNITNFKNYLQSNLPISEFNDIVGYRISRAKRDKGNKSVIDKGLAFRMVEMLYDYNIDNIITNDESYLYQSSFYNKQAEVNRNNGKIRIRSFGVDYDNTDILPDESVFKSDPAAVQQGTVKMSYNYIGLLNPKSQFIRDINYNYIKSEKELFGKYEHWGDDLSWTSDKSRASFWVKYNNYHTNSDYKGTSLPYFTNRIKENNIILEANEQNTFDNFTVINNTQQFVHLSKIDNYPDISNDGLSYGGGPVDLNGSTQNVINDYTTTDLGNNYSKAYYVSLKNYVPSQYGQLYSVTYYPINSCLLTSNSFTLFGGDVFISQYSFRKTSTDSTFVDLDEKTWWSNHITYFVESEINCKLRHELTPSNEDQWYYPYHGTNLNEIYDVIFNNDIIKSESTDIGQVISNYIIGNYCYNPFNYNIDYSKEQDLKPNFPLSLTYNYCNNCENEYPYTIIYSEKSYQEEIADNFRIFPSNNYYTLEGNGGYISNIFKENDILYVRTLSSLWTIPSKYQRLNTDASNISIGTGEIFSLPPKELISLNSGFNGGKTSLDLVVSEYGSLYADVNSNLVFQLKNGQLRNLTESNNRIWFNNNLKFKLLEHTPSFEYYDSPTSNIGIGLIGVYDPKHRRYILTKKDYYPIYPDVTTFNSIDKVWYIGLNNTQITVTNPYSSPEYFENKSFTISYSFITDSWVSWHSYLPNFLFSNRLHYYSTNNSYNYLNQHLTGSYTTYYGIKYPSIIEYVNNKNPITSKISDNITYISNCSTYDNINKSYRDLKFSTFTQGLFYNDSQSTGLLDITVKNNNDPFASVLGSFDPSEIFVERTESNYNISQLRDLVVQPSIEQSIFNNSWDSLKSQYYIDKLPNTNVINYLKSQFEMEPFRDNYLVCRFYYKPVDNNKITFKFGINNFSESIR